MSGFHAFLRERLAAGGFSTEDTLASFLPLLRQVVAAHAAGRVAPLDGLAALQVDGTRIWFHESALRAPRRNDAELQRLDRPAASVEILSESRRTLEVDVGSDRATSLEIATREAAVTRPVHVPGYVCWEQLVGHHDPLTDVFCLGLVLASLGCGLDLAEPADLERFVASRRNPFHLNPRLHPVVAKAIVKMTELSRHERPQDLATVLGNLENYRDQAVDFDLDLRSAEAAAGGGARNPVILGKLRERLFEISRRNRLLHFRSTLGAVNLTHASVPLSFDVKHVRPEQILTWGGELARALSAGEPISLSRHLDFAEQIYLPSVLDRIRTEALRDAAEFGFEQLRLALCFLRWANLKEDPPEHYDSPLVLLPVRLVKKKGVRDTYWLQPIGTEAEVNPVVRHLFDRLHGLPLPATLDLAETTLDALHADLAARIAASEPGVTLRKVDRPRIDLIHDLAQRRVDRYRRSARLSGRGVRSFLDVDYSYEPGNFHPLGLALFRARVKARPTHLRTILQESPAPRSWAAPPAAEAPVAVREKQFYALRESADDNPYHWDFDLCRVTLGNFKYRKMTLVRDYAELLQDGVQTPAFDAVFSLAPRPLESGPPKAPPVEERYHVVACDPTQAAAIGLARAGASYIVQGPPGTGKSQTITNLVADYVMRGKRVLFVAEKRAAIDVVHARLRQRGLDALCCLIHDSQADKKDFIADLKASYERLLAERAAPGPTWRARRAAVLETLRGELQPIAAFDEAMRSAPPAAGAPLWTVLDRAIALSPEAPALAPGDAARLPSHAEWVASADVIEAAAAAIASLRPDGVLARHPLRLLSPAALASERPAQLVASGLAAARAGLATVRGALGRGGAAAARARTLAETLAVTGWAVAVEWLAARDLLPLVDERTEPARRLARVRRELEAARAADARAQEAARHWTDRLPLDEARAALAATVAVEGRWHSVFRPSWWRLRKVLRARYRFAAHAVQPRWSQVLGALVAAYEAAATVGDVERAGRGALEVDAPIDEVCARVDAARAALAALPPAVRALHDEVAGAGGAAALVAAVAAAQPAARALHGTLGAFLVDFEGLPLEELGTLLAGMDEALPSLGDAFHLVGLLARLAPPVAAALRALPLTVRQLEAAVAHACVEEHLRGDRALHRLDAAVRERHLRQLARLARLWQEANAGAVLERAREGFLEHVRIASLPAAELSAEQKRFKAAYTRGRRDLEHELGKVMRHKSIRDLVAGDSGAVIFDLKPVWLMSPLSVSDTLPLRADAFDVVIFDEASQITVEEAVPSIFRAPQTIVVGDEMQLPPTDFFSARGPREEEDEEGLLVGEGGERFEYDLSANSFLNHAARNLPSRMLGWHYRSRSESLIGFSNWAFYQGQLLTVPDERLAAAGAGEIVARAVEDGDANAARVLDRPLGFHLLAHGLYENRRNRAEAAYIARLVRGLLAAPERRSIGIVAFSEAQQGEIEAALAALAREDRGFAARLEAEWEREEDGQLVGLLVKNLENIQGDERDVVILSVCYGRGPDGKMRMNFGPINQSGGERRLNVAFSRAKHHMVLVSSIRHGEITNDYNDGAACLKGYLRYCEAASAGDADGARRVLGELAAWRELAAPRDERPAAVATRIAEALRARGYAVEGGVGMSHFRCDLAVRRHGERRHRLGILVDGEAHYRAEDVLERDLLRPQLLRDFGWTVAQVLSADWHRDPEGVLGRLVRLVEEGPEPEQADAGEAGGDDPWAELDEAAAAVTAASASPSPPIPSSPAGREEAAGEARASPGKRYFELVDASSRKFWEIAVSGCAVVVRFGRLGAAGQTQQKLFADEATAERTAQRLVREKLGKGYVEKAAGGT